MTSAGMKRARRQLHRLAEELREGTGSSRPLSVARTEMQNARMWLGQALGHRGGNTNPYQKYSDPANGDVGVEADTWDGPDPRSRLDTDQVRPIKILRADIGDLIDAVGAEISSGSRDKQYQLAVSQAYVHLTNVRMWLGRQLRLLAESG